MAALKGVNATKIAAMVPADILSPGLCGGNVRCMTDYYVGLGTESASDTIKIGAPLPVGATVLFVTCANTSIGGTVGIGDAVSATRYVSAATDNDVTNSDEEGGGQYTIIATTVQILATVSAAVTAAGTIKVSVFYTVE